MSAPERDWSNVALVLCISAAVTVVVWIIAGFPSEADRERARAHRQASAEAWVQRNKIEATVTCFAWGPSCDVVPKDARLPFKVDCYESGTCEVHP